MTVQPPVPPARMDYLADGSQTRFNLLFPVFAPEDVLVFIDDVLQTHDFETLLTSGVGADVTFSNAPAAGRTVSLIRAVPAKRQTDFQEGSALRAQVLNQEFDHMVAAIHDVAAAAGRALTAPAFEAAPDMEVPPIASRRNFLLGFTGAGAVTTTAIATVDLLDNMASAALAGETGLARALSVRRLDELRGIPGWPGAVAVVQGHHEPADGGGGLFCWAPDGALDDDGGVVIATTTPQGRWIRTGTGGIADIRWFGARGDGVADDTLAIQAALDNLARVGGGRLLVPPGRFRLSPQFAPIPAWQGCLRWTGVDASLSIEGAGTHASRLVGPFGACVFLWLGAAQGGGVRLRDIALAAGAAAPGQGPIAVSVGQISSYNQASLEAIHVESVLFDGVSLGVHGAGARRWRICSNHFRIRGGAAYPAGFAEAINVECDSSSAAGFESIAVTDNVFEGDAANGNDDHSLYLLLNGGSVHIERNLWLAAPTNDVIKVYHGAGGDGSSVVEQIIVRDNRMECGFRANWLVTVGTGDVRTMVVEANVALGSATAANALYLGSLCHHLTVESNIFANLQQSAVYCNWNPHNSGNVTVRDNRVEGYNASGRDGYYCFYVRRCSTAHIHDNRAWKGHANSAGFAGHQDVTHISCTGNVTDGAAPWHFITSSEHPDVMLDAGNSWNAPSSIDLNAGFTLESGAPRASGSQSLAATEGGNVPFKAATMFLTTDTPVRLAATPFDLSNGNVAGPVCMLVNGGTAAITFPSGGNFRSLDGADKVLAPGQAVMVARLYSGGWVVKQITAVV